MIKIRWPIIVAAFVFGLIPSLDSGPMAFELFPRPEAQYTVQRGDTLYGIAGLYYSNPSLWPFLWNPNPSVKIPAGTRYPENYLLQPGLTLDVYRQKPSDVYTVINQEYNPPVGVPDELRFLINRDQLKGIPYDKKYFRYRIGPRPAQVWGYIVSSPDDNKAHFLERDLVYIRFRPSKKQCILVGDRLGIYRERGPVQHPLNWDRSIGYAGDVVGEVEVISTGHNLATAIILDSFEEIVRGDKVCLFVPRAKEIVPTKTHQMLTGTIIRSASRGEDTFYANASHLENDVVFVDRGECDGLKEGMLLNIYRPAHPVQDPYFFRRVATPDRYLGEGMILKTFEKNATVLITRSREEITTGDIIKSVSD